MTNNPEQAPWPVSRGLFAQFSSWLIGRKTDRARLSKAFSLYNVVVHRARAERIYAEWGVPDTPDARLEMIGLQAALLMRRLRAEGDEGKTVAQDLFDVFFADVDRNFREQGVGDLSVGKHVKRAAQTFLARFHALDPALDAKDRSAVAAIVERNIHNRGGDEESEEVADAVTSPADVEPVAPGMLALADHLLATDRELQKLSGAELLAGKWPD